MPPEIQALSVGVNMLSALLLFAPTWHMGLQVDAKG